MREALYPPQICLEVDPYQSTWTQFLLTDQLYLQCTLFAVEAYLDLRLERENSPLTHFHLAKTLRLLQDRLADSDLGSATSDATIMTVTTLGLTTELVGDAAAAEKHMAGLKRMVDLRGGLGMLMESNERLPAKICRSVLVWLYSVRVTDSGIGSISVSRSDSASTPPSLTVLQFAGTGT